MPLVNPRRSWDKITPEFPLAPLREPWETALEKLSISGSSIWLKAAAADMIVRVIFVPVSPSGTGNTLSSLINSFCDSRYFAPPMNILLIIDASIVNTGKSDSS